MAKTFGFFYASQCIIKLINVKTGQFIAKCDDDRVIALKRQKSLWWDSALNVKHALTSEVMWQLMVLFFTSTARMAICHVIQSHSQLV